MKAIRATENFETMQALRARAKDLTLAGFDFIEAFDGRGYAERWAFTPNNSPLVEVSLTLDVNPYDGM